MKRTSRKMFSQKGLSPIVVIVLAAVIGLGAFIFYNNSLNNNPQTKPQSKTTSVLEKIEGPSYVFYYPKDYLKAKLEAENEVLAYQNYNSKAVVPEVIVLRVSPQKEIFAPPTYQGCLGFGETFRTKADDQIKAEVAIGHNQGHGCKITIVGPIDGINDSTVTIIKYLWFKEGTDYSLYQTRALFYQNASRDQAEILNAAVDSFTLN